jgi:peptidyl-prolyl cis-trans isomerase A (cyclophilin A)
MKRFILTVIPLILLAYCALAQKKKTCIITTELGDITVDLYPKKAPVTVANFLKYVDAHLYDGSSFSGLLQ